MKATFQNIERNVSDAKKSSETLFLHLKHSFQYFETELSTSQRPNKWAGGSTFLSFKLGLSILEMLHVTFNIENVAFKVGNVQKNAFPALKATFQILKVSISNLKARE